MTYPGIGPDGVYRLHEGVLGYPGLSQQLEKGGNVLHNPLEEVEDDADSPSES